MKSGNHGIANPLGLAAGRAAGLQTAIGCSPATPTHPHPWPTESPKPAKGSTRHRPGPLARQALRLTPTLSRDSAARDGHGFGGRATARGNIASRLAVRRV